MIQLLIIAFGGALGAVSRYLLATWINTITATNQVETANTSILNSEFPWGTLCVNVLGSLLMGFVYVLIIEKTLLPEASKHLLMAGFLGAFTTFSTFSLDAWLLIEKGEIGSAIAYVLASVVICVLALALGMYCSRTFIS